MSCYTEIAAVHAMQAALVPMGCTATILLYWDSSAWASWGLHSMLSVAREQDDAATLQPLLPGTGRGLLVGGTCQHKVSGAQCFSTRAGEALLPSVVASCYYLPLLVAA